MGCVLESKQFSRGAFKLGSPQEGLIGRAQIGGQVWETTDSGRSQPLQCWAQPVTNSLFQILFLALDG